MSSQLLDKWVLQGVDELTGITDMLLGCLQPCLGSLQGKGPQNWDKQVDWTIMS